MYYVDWLETKNNRPHPIYIWVGPVFGRITRVEVLNTYEYWNKILLVIWK
jgi:hypothetical protein